MTDADTIMGGWADGSWGLLTPHPLLSPEEAQPCTQTGQARESAAEHPGLHKVKCGVHDILQPLVRSLVLGTNVNLTGYCLPGPSVHCIFLPNHPLDA